MKRFTAWGLALAAILTFGALGAAPAQAAETTTLKVSVTTPAGKPISGQMVIATQNNGTGYGNGQTDANGVATLANIPYGSYHVYSSLHFPGYDKTLETNVTLSTSTASAALKIPGGAITGTVTLGGKPVASAWLYLTPSKGEQQTAWTDASGQFRAYGIPAGHYTVQVASNSYASPTYLATYAGNTVRLPSATSYTIATGTEKVGVTIAVKRDAGVRGKIVDRKGKPVANTYVWASNLDRAGSGAASTNASGSYVIHGLASGKVEVSVYAKNTPASKRAKVATGKTKNAGTLKLPKVKATGSIKGMLKNKAGKKHPATVSVLGAKNLYVGGSQQITTKGRYTVSNLAPGKYKVVVSGTGVYRTVKVKVKKTTKVRTLVRPKGTTISGVVKTASGKRAKKVSVWAVDSLGTYVGGTTTNAKGKYSVKGAVKGTYVVWTGQTKTALSTSRSVRVKKGHKAKVNLRLVTGAKLKVTVKAGKKAVKGISVAAYPAHSTTTMGYGGVGKTTNAKGRATVRPLPRTTLSVMATDPYPGGYVNAKVTVKKGVKKATLKVKTRK